MARYVRSTTMLLEAAVKLLDAAEIADHYEKATSIRESAVQEYRISEGARFKKSEA